jgi:hypothetical protein
MKRQLLFAVVLIASLLLATGSAAAKATRTEFSYTLFICSMDEPDKQWTTGKPPDGQVYHWRGQNNFGRFVSTEEGMEWWNGTVPGRSSGDVKVDNSAGTMHGTFEKQFENGVNGTFAGPVHAKLTDDGLWHIWGGFVRGTGDLEGVLYHADGIQLTQVPPGDPCPEDALTAYAMTAVLIDTHGNLP